jgi:hypothetical protein
MSECGSGAVVKLNEAEASAGTELFQGTNGHDGPFHSKRRNHSTNAPRTMKAIFKGKARSERGASRAQTKAQRAIFDKLKIAIISANVNL